MAVERNLREHAWEIVDAAVSEALEQHGKREGLPDVGWALLSDGIAPWIEGMVWTEGITAYREAYEWMEVLGGRESWTGPDRRAAGFWYFWSDLDGLRIALRIPAAVEAASD